jgi:hypothetical protein
LFGSFQLPFENKRIVFQQSKNLIHPAWKLKNNLNHFCLENPEINMNLNPNPKSLGWVRSGLNQDRGFMEWNPENPEFWFGSDFSDPNSDQLGGLLLLI